MTSDIPMKNVGESKLEMPRERFNDPVTGRFIPGSHWRVPKPYWDPKWLRNEYLVKRRSSKEIADEFGCQDSNILYFLAKFGIKVRTVAEARRVKYWGAIGKDNPMFGRLGFLNPRWNGGHSPERQSVYARHFWKELAKQILARDHYRCTRCGTRNTTGNRLEVHHVKPWSAYPELRFESNNLQTLCHDCHRMVTREEVKARKK